MQEDQAGDRSPWLEPVYDNGLEFFIGLRNALLLSLPIYAVIVIIIWLFTR